MSDKYAADLPLPGGVEQYYETLVALLRQAADKLLAHEQLKDTVRTLCPNARKSTAIGQYIGLIRMMGYWFQDEGGVYRLTSCGNELLELATIAPDKARQLVLANKVRDFLGYDVILTILTRGTATFDAIDKQLQKHIGVNWQSNNQTTFRLNWLRSLGFVERNGHEYGLTRLGQNVARVHFLPPCPPSPPPVPTPISPPCQTGLMAQATVIADRIAAAAIQGGTGVELERATAEAFEFLGFCTQIVSGAGNPDVVATAALGGESYRVIVETKSRANGVISQNDVNFNALIQHKCKVNADFVMVIGKEFSGGNLEEWATAQNVRLLRVAELRGVLTAHAAATIPMDRLQSLFLGGGSTDESVLSLLLADSEAAAQLMLLCRDVFDAVINHQSKEAALNEHSLFYILGSKYSIQAIRSTTELMKSDLLAALGTSEQGSLYCRLSQLTLAQRIVQIQETFSSTVTNSTVSSDKTAIDQAISP